MSWREQLRPASFRDAAFHIDAADQDGGRRTVVHEFVQRDDAYVEDLGLLPDQFRLDGIVLGEDYMTARDALIAACRAAGPGTLVHPYRGSMLVSLQTYNVRESSQDGGMAVFSMVFVASAVAALTGQAEDTKATAEAAAATASAEAVEGFDAGFSVAGLPGFVADGAAAQVQGLGDRLQGAMARLGGAQDALSNAAVRIAALRSNALDLVRRTPDLGGSIFGLITSFRLLASTPRSALSELRSLIGFAPSADAWVDTPARRAQVANGAAIGRMVTLSASAEAVRAATELTFDSYDDAVAVRDDLAERLDEAAFALADQGDDAGYGALTMLRLTMVRDVTQRGGSLARLYTYSPTATEPALVTAQRLYGDATRAQEIVDRNRIRHPGFVPAGVVLEVLTDG